MNKTYKIIWSHVRKCYVVVSEYARSHGKNNTKSVLAWVTPILFGGTLLASTAMPSWAAAQNIEKVNGEKFNNQVNQIYADKLVNSTAVNAFKNFELDAGRIANMHMGTAANPNAAGSLVNFVNNQVSISGTVNAVKNGGIGGNLYFLSPNGVVVGSSGVINAGSVHLMAPSQSQYNVLVGDSGVNDTAFSQNWSKIQDGSIALNADATIKVAGRINTVDGASLRGGNVNLQSGASVVAKDSLDFSSLVNVSTANAGLMGNLSLQKASDSEKIVLAAVGNSGTTSDWTSIELKPTVTVAEGATVSAAGDVSVTAAAKNEEAFALGTVEATVNANGEITGKNVNIAAKAEDVFVTNGGDHAASLHKFFTGSGSYDVLGAGADVLRLIDVDTVLALHHVKAETNIGKNAVIKATGADPSNGKALSITADSTLTAGMATNPDGIVGGILDIVNDRHLKLRQGAQSTSVAVAKLDNKAVVNVEGKLQTDQGGAKVVSNATASPTVSAKEALSKTDNVTLALGIGVLVGENISEVNLKDTANIQNITNSFDATAKSTEKVSLTAGAKATANAMAGTAAAVMDYDSSATLNVDTAIHAGEVNLSSKNTVKSNKINASNSIGASTQSAENMEQSLFTNSSKYIGNIKNTIVDGVFKKFFKMGSPEQESSLFEDAKSLFNAGASVAVASETNTAKTTLTKNADIWAAGNVKVTSDMQADSTHMYASGSMGNAAQKKIDENNKESVQKVKIQASVLVADLDSSAEVVVEEGTADKHAKISGSDVTVTATSKFTHVIDELKKAFDDSKEAIEKLDDAELSTAWTNLALAVNNYETDVGTVGDIAPAAMAVLDALKKYPSAYTTIASKVTAFLKLENYANFSVSSATEGGSDKNPSYNPTRDLSKDNAKLAIAGAVDVALTDDSAKVNLGKYADIKGTGATAIKAELERADSSLNGNLGLQTGDQNAVGGVVSFFKADRNAEVTIAEGSAVEGNTLSLNVDSTTTHVDLATGASMGGDSGVKGMVTYVMGDNTAKVDIAGNTALKSTGAMDITGNNTANLMNIAGSFGFGAATGVGASLALNDMEVNSIVNVGSATINAGSLKATTDLDGKINSLAIAGGIAAASDDDEAGGMAKLTTKITNSKNKVMNVWRSANDKLNSIVPDIVKKAADIKENKKLKTDNVAKNPTANKKLSDISVAGAGSVAINLLDRTTHTIIDGATINLNNGNLALSATDSGFTGAWAGAAGLTFNTRKLGGQNENSTNVGVAGSVGWSDLDLDTVSVIRNSKITNAAAITNEAERSGAMVSAGLGMALATSGDAKGGSSYTGAASVSVADIDNILKAELANNTVTNSGSVTNTVTDSDTLVTGGVNASIAAGKSKSAAVGGSVVYNRIDNQMDALITGGSYALTRDLTNKISTGITEVGGAVGLALATSSGSGGKSYGFEGAVAYNGLTNTANAILDGAAITARNVAVDARDTKDLSKQYDTYINERGLDATGKTYAEAIEDALDDEGKANISSEGGNIIVGAALSAAASLGESGSAAVDAALSISEVDNDFTAVIKNGSKITGSGLLNVKADSKTLAIGAAAGGGGTSDGFGGAGSFSWQTDSNDVTAEISGSEVKGMSGSIVNANTAAKDINVAGQVAVGNVAVGLAGAYNRLENTTGAYVKNSQFADDTAKTIAIGAKNEGRVYAVTAGVAASREKLAANGAVAVNSGADNIKAELSGGTMKNANSISVASEDDTKKLAVAGGFTLSQGTAIGGAVAYNAIGDTDRQINSAIINGTTIDHNTSKINVTAADTSGLTTIGFGVGLANGSPAVNGAAAVGLKSADVTAEVAGTNIKNSTGNLNVKASTTDDFSTNAAVAAVGESAAIGVGVGVTRDETHTTARFSGGSFTGNDFDLGAASHADITTVGVGGGVNYGSGLGLAGSATVNLIDTETKALVNNGANISAKSPAVTAISDEKIANYVGALSVSSQGAAIGASVSVNEIDSETEAAVEGANTVIKSTGDATHSVKDTVSDDEILDGYVDKDIFKSSKSLKDARTAKTYTGLLVDASGTHTMKSFLVNAGGTGTGAAVNGTVDMNLIGGSTKARITDAKVNNASANRSNVNVIAHDYANSAGVVGTANVALEGAAVGLGSDTNKITRTTEASLIGPSAKYDLYANDVNIEAKSRQGVGSLAAGGSFAGEGAAVNAASGVTLLDGTTNAFLKNVNIKNAGNISLTADHLSRFHLIGTVFTGAGIGAGLSIAVGYVSDTGTTEATAENINVEYAANKKGDLNVKANNELKVNYMEVGIGAAGLGAGLAGSIGVSEANSTAKAQLKNSTIGTSSKRAKNANIMASNQLTLDQKAGVGSAGAAGVGVGVSVNKLDSTTNVNIDNSKVYAGAINAGASDNKYIWQTAGNASIGGSAMGLNVMVTNVGKDISSTYDAGDGKTKMNVSNVFQDINDAMKAGNLSKEESHGVVGSDGKNITNTRNTVTMTAQKKDSASGITVMGSTLDSAGDVTLLADAATNAEMKSVVAAAGGSAAVSGTVAVLDVAGNSVGEVRNSAITTNSGDITIATHQGGLSQLEVKQGSLSGTLALSGAYGKVSKSGLTDLQLSGNTINAGNLSLTAVDESRAKIDALGASGAIAGSVNVLIGDVENKGKVSVALQGGNTLKATDKLLVDASRSPEEDDQKTAEVTTEAVSVAIGVAGTGISATAHDASETAVTLNTAKNKNANSLSADTIGIAALNSPSVKTETKSAAASLLVSGAVTVADSSAGTKSAPVKSTVDIGDGTSLLADETDILAQNEIGLTTDMKGLGISGYVAAQVNTGRADAYGDSKINLGKVNVQDGGMLMVMSNTNVTKDIKAAGVSAAGLVASGTNVAKSDSVLNSAINANGTNDKQLQIALLLSTASEDNTARADGDGGAAVDISPYAAKLENSLTTNTKTNVSGNWNASLFAAGAELTDKHDFTTDATRAAIAGGSGVGITNTATHTTAINVNNANIRTNFTQGYNADNNIDYKDTQKAGSYGGVTGSDSAVKNTINAAADVNITGSTLKGLDESSLRAQANTDSKIVSKNNVEGAGVVQILVGSSDSDTSFTDRVTVNNANLSTEKGDISLAATSDIDHDLEAESVDEGGAAGVTTVKNTNKLTRRDKVDITGSSKLASGHDLMLLAGADENKTPSNLRLLTYANAHNATFIPAETSPTINETLTLDRGVTVGSSANTSSIRHTYLRADEGSAYIEESARQFEIWGQGELGNRRLTSTALGDSEVSQNKTAKVDVQGKVTAGIHNRLDIDITGNITRKGTSAQNAEIDTSGLKIQTAQDWFDVNSTMKSITVKNPYMERYNELLDAMKDYKSNTDEYGLLNRELQNVISAMTAENFVYKDENGDIALLEEIPVAGISLPDINVSGGNVYVNAATLAGDKNINTSGAPQINITNRGNAYMLLGNVKIEDGGGRLYQNDNILREASGESAINIKSLGKEDGNGISRPDISIDGSVDNLSGAVNITNRTADIGITGAVNGKSVSINADTGAVYLSQPEAFVNVGGDPIAKYMFDETTAAKIQKAITSDFSKANRTSGSKFFKTYDEYRNWLKSVARLTDSEMKYTDESERKGIIAGGNISITAKDVNINGLIQSGYTRYVNQVTDDEVARRDYRLYGQWFSDDDVLGNELYRVGKSGMIWNSETKMYDYAVPMYYNPYTKHLLTDDIDVRGGRVDIRGRIASTGGGRIVVADGPADININAKGANYDLYMGRITNNDREGFIRIYDPWGKLGIDESTSTMHRAYKPGEAETTPWEEGKRNGYRPASRSTLRWTGGTSGQKVMDKYYRKYYASFFGLFNLWSYGTTDDLVKNIGSDIKNVRTTTRATNADGTMKQGVILDERGWQVLEDNPDGVYLFLTSYNTGNTTYGKVNASKMRYTNWAHTEGYVDYSWTETSGNSTDSITVISAARPIYYTFAQAEHNGLIELNSGGSLYFRDNVENVANLREGKTDQACLSINAVGDVKTLGNARLSTGYLTASGKSIDIAHTSIDNRAAIDLITNGGNINFNSNKGNLKIRDVRIRNAPDNGKITIVADGNIDNYYSTTRYFYKGNVSESGSIIEAPSITLISENGSIGTGYGFFLDMDMATGNLLNSGVTISPLRVKAGSSVTSSNLKNSSLTVTAKKDINILQTEGDMRVGRIESKEGDVTLEAKNGSIVDANGGAFTDDSSAEDKIARWQELGLISDADGDNSRTEAAKASKAKKLAIVEGRFKQLASVGEAVVDENKLRAYKDAADEYNTYYKNVVSKARNQAEWEKFINDFWNSKGYTTEEVNLVSTYAFHIENNMKGGMDKIEAGLNKLSSVYLTEGLMHVDTDRVAAYKNAANDYAKNAAIIAARKEYITAMQAATTDLARTAARAKLQAAKDAYFKGKGFSADEQKAIADYGDLSVSENYGWSRNELLYAVQNGIVNSQPGLIDIVNTPNISGKNIMLLAPKGGIGYDEAKKYIKNEDITKEANMKLLASAKAGDLTWDKDGVTIRRQVPVTLDVAEGGTVLLNGKTNVYASATVDSAMNIKGGIDTDGDIRLSAGKGISIADGTMIRGRNLTLMSGAGDIGASNKFLEMMVNGWLMANSGNSIYVHQNGNMPLTLLSAAAGMDAYLRADNGIRMYNGYGMDMGYINAGRTVDLYTKKGDIEGIRILANGTWVNAKAPAGKVSLVNVGGELKIANNEDAPGISIFKKLDPNYPTDDEDLVQPVNDVEPVKPAINPNGKKINPIDTDDIIDLW
ncbi:leukotoxin LktA family filamentous adhesin [Selenomonas ruminantium]|uniref:leukotoxin LktA family filamentous adhesin n=1 Tax=Selenomonas ruminantium TaxID=971 RepID=UPI0026EC52FC|nr:leukotoxin LktA family filamentous adhesin [Selenomonas ruminantium]